MKATIYIPYANGDCVRGFKYDKQITAKEYVNMETTEYIEHKDGVDNMMPSLGYNIAVNPYTKRKRKYTNQTYYYHTCPCHILSIEGQNMGLAQFDELYRNNEQFGVIVNLNLETYRKKPDMSTDLTMWFLESKKVMSCPNLDDLGVMEHLPKKDFKIHIDDDNSTAILKDCKFMQMMGDSKSSFAMIVNKIIFVKE